MSEKPKRRGMHLGQTALTVYAQEQPVQVAPGFLLTVNGLVVEGEPEFDRWAAVGEFLRVAEKSAPFALGDYLNAVEAALGEQAAQIVDYSSGWSEKTCSVYRWIASRIAREDRRMDRLGIRHHLLVAVLTPAKQRKWLTKAVNEGGDPWTVKRPQDALKEGEDLPVTAFWVLVMATDANDQSALMAALEAQGRTVKATVRRQRRSEPAAPEE